MNAASDNASQYILITPQGKMIHNLPILIHVNLPFFFTDASNMEPGPFIHVHRMADPDRS
jgi:hypothetical protein